MVPLFRHNTPTKEGGSTSKYTMMMDGPDSGKSTMFMLLFTGLYALNDVVKIGESGKHNRKKGAKNNGSRY